MKKNKISLLFASLFVSAGCAPTGSSSSNPPVTGECMINDFESDFDLSMMRFPFPVHEARGKFELSDEHVTHGSKSLKFSNIYNSSFQMEHFFSHCASKDIDISNIKAIEVDIYNDSAFDTTCSLTIYNNEALDILTKMDFDLPKQQLTHVSFPLSKIALEYNHQTVVSSALTLMTPNTDYERFVGYTFYIDNWKAVMGGEYTEEDLRYQSKINSVRDAINALPEKEFISVADEAKFEQIAKEYCALPDLYRRIVPNYNVYKEKLATFSEAKFASLPRSMERNYFIPGNEFYGASQITPTTATAAEVFFDDSIKIKAGDKGSTKVVFSGSIHSQFNYKAPISTAGYDELHFIMRNETGHYCRVWIDYMNMVYFDIAKGETVEFTMTARLFGAQTFWTVDQLSDAMDGTVVPGTGSLHIGEIYLTGRSEEVRKAELLEAFNKLPDPVSVVTESDMIKCLSVIEIARSRYDEATDDIRSVISNALYVRLNALETKAKSEGYGLAYNASRDFYNRYYYGEFFRGVAGVLDDTYGYVQKISLNDPRSDQGVPEQAIGFENEVQSAFGAYKVAFYNPTSSPVKCVVRNTNWEWEKYEEYFTTAMLAPNAWTEVEINPTLFSISSDGKVCFFLSNPDEMVSLHGDWLMTSLFGLPR